MDACYLCVNLGLDYQRIHACPNDCMLYWAENEKENNCKTCGVSRKITACYLSKKMLFLPWLNVVIDVSYLWLLFVSVLLFLPILHISEVAVLFYNAVGLIYFVIISI